MGVGAIAHWQAGKDLFRVARKDGEEGFRLGSKVSRWHVVGGCEVLGFPSDFKPTN